MKNRAVFLDRDGTINERVEYLSDPEKFKLLPRAAGAVKLLNKTDFKVIVVTNQAGVGRGYFTEEKLEEIHQEMKRQLRRKKAYINAVYYCPHHPTEGIGKYKKNCWYRKPNPGMLEKAAKDFNLDLRRCYTIGDNLSDLEVGNRVNCKTILVLTGYGKKCCANKNNWKFNIEYVADDLLEGAKWILREEGKYFPWKNSGALFPNSLSFN